MNDPRYEEAKKHYDENEEITVRSSAAGGETGAQAHERAAGRVPPAIGEEI